MSLTKCYRCGSTDISPHDEHRAWCRKCQEWIHDKKTCKGCNGTYSVFGDEGRECGIQNRCIPADYAYYSSQNNCTNCGHNKKGICKAENDGITRWVPTSTWWGLCSCKKWISKEGKRGEVIARPYKEFKYYTLDTIDECKGWNAFITPDGLIYTSNRIMDLSRTYTHNSFAIDYLSRVHEIDAETEFKKLNLNYSLSGSAEYLIHFMGWVSFGHTQFAQDVNISIPSPKYNGKMITDKQRIILMKLFELNGDSLDQYFEQVEGKIFSK